MNKSKVIIPTILGSVVEYYDFGMYAVFASVIGLVFFNIEDEFIRSMVVFGLFAIGFLLRPLGGVIFGHIGDKFGRKTALKISILGMSSSTFLMAILPGYDTIGVLAPITLLLIRVIQSLCIGGEGTGSAVFILEHLSKNKLSFIGSIVMAANMFGTFLAMIVGWTIEHSIGLDHFTWRYGFFFGTLMGLIGVHLRRKSHETPVFDEMKNKNKLVKMPFFTLIKQKSKVLVLVIAVAGAYASFVYMIRGYLTTFFFQIMSYPTDQTFEFTSFCLLFLIILLPIFGIISDYFGQSTFLRFVAILIMLLSYPAFFFIANPEKNILLVYIGLTIMSILGAAISAPAYPYAIKVFPPEFRYSGVALGWNIGNAFFGGTTPFFATIIVKNFSPFAPAFYLIFTSALFLIISMFFNQYSYERLRRKIAIKKKKMQKLTTETI